MPGATTWTVVVAGGSGRRFGGAKQFAPFGRSTVLAESVRVAAGASDGVVVVVPLDAVTNGHLDELDADAVVVGGATRSASVRAGLAAVPLNVDVVLVHDAARPLATSALFRRVMEAIELGADGAVPVIPVGDSLRTTAGAPVDRDGLVAVQTPQGFRASALRSAHATEPEASDDASLVTAAGGMVVHVEGERWNFKLTEPSDLVVADAVWNARIEA